MENITPMEQLIDVMTKNIKDLVDNIICIEHNHYVLILSTGEHIHFTKNADE